MKPVSAIQVQPDRAMPPQHNLEAKQEDLLLQPDVFVLNNKLPVHLIPEPSTGLFRLDIVFPAGTWFESQPLAAYFTSRMLREGTPYRNSTDIAEAFDYFGAYLDERAERDRAVISLYCPQRFASNVLPLLSEIIAEPIFPEPLLEVELQHQRQDFLINQERVAVLARNHFSAHVFGPYHPYGKLIQSKDFDAIHKKHLLTHYQSFYHLEGAYAILSGDINQALINQINQSLGAWSPDMRKGQAPDPPYLNKENNSYFNIPKEGSLQSAIRMGRSLFTRRHPDYIPLQIAVTILGGYFGSRLMKNIREDKGYTYGISASLQTFEHQGLFLISAEVGKDFIHQTMDEIRWELDRLSHEPVSKEELTLVQHYLIGSLMRGLDGAFPRADRLRGLIDNQLDANYFIEWHDKLRSIKSEEVMTVSRDYLQFEEMVTVVAG